MTKITIINYFKRIILENKRHFFKLLISLAFGSIINYFFPLLAQTIVDHGIKNKDIGLIQLILLGQLTFLVGQTSLNIYRNWLTLHISTIINLKITKDFIHSLLIMPISIIESKAIGDLLQRITDIRRIDNFLTNAILLAIFSIMNVCVYSVLLLSYSKSIFIVYFITIIVSLIWTRLFIKKRKSVDYKYFDINSNNNNRVVQIIHGIKDIQLNNAESTKLRQWENVYRDTIILKLKTLLISQYQQSGVIFFSNLRNFIVTYIAANLVIEGTITIGMMLAITYINGQLSAPIDQLFSLTQSSQDAVISFNRLNELRDCTENTFQYEIKNKEVPKMQPQNMTGNIVINNVSFSYPNHEEDVLENINIVFERGKTTAIMGMSGHGKTTIIKLLLKYYSSYKGSICIGNYDLRTISNTDWRKRCSCVLPDGYIFTDSIANNIALNNEEIDLQRVQEVAQIANINEFVQSLDKQYNTLIGPDTKGLSEGQKQRLLIARALYRDPEFLFLDEATNYLDSENESIIINNLKKMNNKTIILVTHRISTIKAADNIIQIYKGRVKNR